MDWFWAIVAIVGSVGGIGVLIYLQARGGHDRDEEDDARAFFDEHGHWPDETPGQVEDRRRAAEGSARATAAAAQAGVADVDVEDRPPPRERRGGR